jgi:hypothetical protein
MVIPLNNSKTTNYPVCAKCNSKLDQRVPRGVIVKTFLFWLPIKRYLCFKCNKKKYVLSKN